MVKLYHYTTYDNLLSIKRERVIRASSSRSSVRDMFHGPGVYLTRLDPGRYSKPEIGRNNWSGGGQAKVAEGKVDYYVMVEIPETDYWLEECEDQQDKWLYTTDLCLDDYEWRSGKNSDWKDVAVDVAVATAVAVGVVGLVAGGKALWDHLSKEEEKDKRK